MKFLYLDVRVEKNELLGEQVNVFKERNRTEDPTAELCTTEQGWRELKAPLRNIAISRS